MLQWQVPAQTDGFNLASVDPASTPDVPGDEEATTAAFKDLRKELIDAQERLYAEDKQSLLVVIQAIDGGGKDGTIKNVFKGVNPQGCRV
ncbi:MAG TPA: polyphosphate kinase 2 family protein, partial [Acidimicrobiales bacterium]|nr:polyphosphate kinase 2 family protein [Acidimicrobiales bacterium]